MNLFGATVTSYQTSAGREVLFMSRLAKTDGTRAVRGGIPLVFPQFGRASDPAAPQHGFLRCNYWEVADDEFAFDDEDGAGRSFVLDLENVLSARGDQGKWAAGTELNCRAVLSVRVGPDTLATTLTIANVGTVDFEFQALFHTYYNVAGGKALDNDLCYVSGLGGYSVIDKVTGETYTQKEDEKVVINGEVDRIYNPPVDATTTATAGNTNKADIDVEIATGEGGSKVTLHASAVVGGTSTPVSVVVWNPHIEKAKSMGDFADEQYRDMICVEPGLLNNVPALAGGKEAVFTQVITARL